MNTRRYVVEFIRHVTNKFGVYVVMFGGGIITL